MTQVSPAYKWDAQDYAQSSKSQQQWARELIQKLHLTGDERVLDIGCGDGKVTAEIAACLPRGRVVGVDSSAEMVGLAQSRYPSWAVRNLSFQQAAANRLPFEREFTQVFSNAALHWVLDHKPVLCGINSCLVPGGRVLLQMGGKGNAADVVRVMNQLVLSDEWRGFFDGFTFPYGFYGPEEYALWMREAGLLPGRIELIPKDMVHADRASFEGWVRTTWLPYTQRVPENKRKGFLAQFADSYIASNGADPEGAVHVKMVRLEVEALKQDPI